MIKHKIYSNEDWSDKQNGELKIVYKNNHVKTINETAVSPSDAEGLCALRCFENGVLECSFYSSDGKLVAKAWVV